MRTDSLSSAVSPSGPSRCPASPAPSPRAKSIGSGCSVAHSDLGMVGPQPRGSIVNALLRGLRELGYVYGEHFVTEPRGAEGKPERFPGLAAELVRLQVDGCRRGAGRCPRSSRPLRRSPSSWRAPATRWARASSRASDDRAGTSPG